MEFILKALSALSFFLGLFILGTSAIRRFEHPGMAMSGAVYVAAGVMSFAWLNWWPVIAGIILVFLIKAKFGEPDYSRSPSQGKDDYENWCRTYRPLMGAGQPLNYMEVIQRITDMTDEQKEAYLDEKDEKK